MSGTIFLNPAPGFKSPKTQSLMLVMTGLLLFAPGCQTTDPNSPEGMRAMEGYSPAETDKLFIVDCLLPGQVRKLGTQMTYLTARRAIKTSAGECEVRGGEYVAYDRANLASALKIWLPLAQQGDTEAQINVGEIYEKGLGTQSDPRLAAEWYRKAAEKGHSRAQINLGYLYEKGLGVEQNMTTALNWYRKASGLDTGDLQFASVATSQVNSQHEEELEALRQDAARRQFEADQLRKQLTETQSQLKDQQDELESLKNNLELKKKSLNEEKNKSSRNESRLKQLEQELKSTQTEFNEKSSQLSSIEKNLKTKEKSIQHHVQSAKVQQQTLTAKAPPAPTASVNRDTDNKLEKSRMELAKKEKLLQAQEKEYQTILKDIKSSLENPSQSSAEPKQREHLSAQKKALQTQGQSIASLKKQITLDQEKIAQLENKQPVLMALAAPNIEILDPPMVLTRGIPSLQLRSIAKTKEITGKVEAPAGLKSFLVNDKPGTIDDLGYFRLQVTAEQTASAVNLVAIDQSGKKSSLSFNVVSQTEGTSESSSESDVTPSRSDNAYKVDFGHYHALIIGNNDYAEMPTLKTAVNDAKSIDAILRQRYGYKTTLLINANRHKIMSALNTIRNSLKENDNLLIYYAGHGERDKTSLAAYWLPTDAEVDNTANWISSDDITQYLNIISARHILVVADSCYSGAMTGTAIARLPNEMPEAKREKWLKFMTTRKARTVLTSGGVAPVLDQGAQQHSIFARAFIDALQSNSGIIEDYDIFRTVSKQVRVSAARVGFDQSPQYAPLKHAGHEGSPFFFVPKS
ncbi:MAG: caspase family protein [Methylomicrobium sp.]|nr:caspase family protein [Methylomicrobium sp.]